MNHVQPMGHSFLWLVIAVSMMLWSGCSLRMPLQSETLDVIPTRKPAAHSSKIIVAAPRGVIDSVAVEYATVVGAAVGGVLIVERVPQVSPSKIASPSSLRSSIASRPENAPLGVEWRSAKSVLRSNTFRPIDLYFSFESAGLFSSLSKIEITATGLTAAQIQALKVSYNRISARAAEDRGAPVVELALQTVDDLPWVESNVERRSILALVARGLAVRLPPSLSATPLRQSYAKILSLWIGDVVALIRRDSARLPAMKVELSEFGKFESISGDPAIGLVIGAPHGTFDPHTAGIVRYLCAQSGFPGVIARGFTPAETGGWRINVNRPTERHVATDERENETARARQAFHTFKEAVLSAANGKLNLYIEIHQNAGRRIEVATVGISPQTARSIQETFQELRDAGLASRSDIAPVELAIEPLDDLEVGAWAAKSNGMLTLAKQSLHFELPSYGMMSAAHERKFYAAILVDLIQKVIPNLARR